jgi:5'-nucleotidase
VPVSIVVVGPTEPELVGTTTTATAESMMTYGTDGSVRVTVAPATASGEVTVLDGSQTVGTGILTAGSADVTIDGEALGVGSHTLTVRYAGDSAHQPSEDTVTVEVTKAVSTTSASASPGRVTVVTGTSRVSVSVEADGVEPTGTVEAVVGGRVVDSATLLGGLATLEVGPFGNTGEKTVEVRYSGDGQVAASSTTTSVRVVKAEPRITASHAPEQARAGKTRATVSVKVKVDGFVVSGWVQVRVPGHGKSLVRLEDGKATLKLPKFEQAGTKTLRIAYLGNSRVEGGSITHDIAVVKK